MARISKRFFDHCYKNKTKNPNDIASAHRESELANFNHLVIYTNPLFKYFHFPCRCELVVVFSSLTHCLLLLVLDGESDTNERYISFGRNNDVAGLKISVKPSRIVQGSEGSLDRSSVRGVQYMICYLSVAALTRFQ